MARDSCRQVGRQVGGAAVGGRGAGGRDWAAAGVEGWHRCGPERQNQSDSSEEVSSKGLEPTNVVALPVVVHRVPVGLASRVTLPAFQQRHQDQPRHGVHHCRRLRGLQGTATQSCTARQETFPLTQPAPHHSSAGMHAMCGPAIDAACTEVPVEKGTTARVSHSPTTAPFQSCRSRHGPPSHRCLDAERGDGCSVQPVGCMLLLSVGGAAGAGGAAPPPPAYAGC